ncbi:MAG: hypothetical protein ACYT04_74970 [Nostoc sp.]
MGGIIHRTSNPYFGVETGSGLQLAIACWNCLTEWYWHFSEISIKD